MAFRLFVSFALPLEEPAAGENVEGREVVAVLEEEEDEDVLGSCGTMPSARRTSWIIISLTPLSEETSSTNPLDGI